MALIEWTAQLAVGYDSIDNTHHEFVDLVNQLGEASNDKAAFSALFLQLVQHTEHHFNAENQMMAQCRFPATAVHQAEHQRVLNEMKQFQRQIERGMLSMAKAYIKERVPEWFVLHAATMDGALAFHMKLTNNSGAAV